MKKIIISILINLLLIINVNSYYILSKNQSLIENKLNFAISRNLESKNLESREILRKNLDLFQKNNEKYFNIIENVKMKNGLYDYNNQQEVLYEKYKINRRKIDEAWLSFHNHERKQIGLGEFKYSKFLNSTSYERSKNQSFLGEMTHKRLKNDVFYNHNSVTNWFNHRGINCKPIGGISVTESIAKYSYFCYNNDDCSQELISSIREIFVLYMAEKGLKYPEDAHYRAIVHKNLNILGLGIEIKETNHKNLYEYYLTTHYCSELLK